MKNQYWHFSAANKRLGYGDGREVIAGKTLSVDGESCCEKGLHATQEYSMR